MCKVGQWWQEGAVGCIRPRAAGGHRRSAAAALLAGHARCQATWTNTTPTKGNPSTPQAPPSHPPTDCLGAVWVRLSSGRSCAPGGGCALPVLVCLLSRLSWLVVPELLLLTRRAAALPHYNSSTGGTPTPSAPPTTHLGKTQNMTWGRCELCGECFRMMR